MRGADPAIVLVPGVGMFSFGKDKQTARVAGEFYVNAINVMRGAEAVSTYAPIERGGEVPHRVLGAGGGQARSGCRSPSRWPPGSRWSPAPASGIGKAIATRLAAEGALRRRRRPRPGQARQAVADELGGPDVAVARRRRRHRRGRRRRRVRAPPCSRSAGSTWWSTTPGCRSPSRCWRPPSSDWDLQHDVMAKGSFLVSREAARVMIEQELGGDIVYISTKNAVFAGPNNIAYSATKADQAHQVRLLAAELGEHGIRVNGINPDGVVRGSGHLRRRLGRQPGRRLRRQGGGARRVLRPAHPAQARGAARARRRRRVRAHRRRPDADHRPAHPGRLRRRRRVPAMTRTRR